MVMKSVIEKQKCRVSDSIQVFASARNDWNKNATRKEGRRKEAFGDGNRSCLTRTKKRDTAQGNSQVGTQKKKKMGGRAQERKRGTDMSTEELGLGWEDMGHQKKKRPRHGSWRVVTGVDTKDAPTSRTQRCERKHPVHNSHTRRRRRAQAGVKQAVYCKAEQQGRCLTMKATRDSMLARVVKVEEKNKYLPTKYR
jgi:hypothetical protein